MNLYKYRYRYRYLLIIGIVLVLLGRGQAQWASHRSVLADHEWYKIGVVEDGVYGLDYATLQSWGVDPREVNPAKIRLFGNVQGPLPEANAAERFDDLTETAIVVTGAEDGSFDEGDWVLFYGQGPVKISFSAIDNPSYERNPYSDTVYYFMCVDSDFDGLRIDEQASVVTDESAPVLDRFLDCHYHEIEEISPYASGRNWYGDLITGQEGYKEFQVEVPGLVMDRGVRVISKVLGRCKPATTYNLKVNDEFLVNAFRIDAYKEREYGKEHLVNKMAHPNSESFALRYEFNESQGNPMLFVDYFVLSYWRELRCYGPELAFPVVMSQLIDNPVRVSIEGAVNTMTCWEVTDPIHPVKQLMEPGRTGMSFGLEGAEERRFLLFQMDAVKQVASCRPIPNQNMHGMESAELLIITPRVFWPQAQAFSDYHTQYDGMNCVLADVAEVFNEFGTGTPDPTAIRDFIRMLYLRSGGALKYVLLLGKGTHDFRCIKGVDNNFIPTYQTSGQENIETMSLCTDDYFALMDEDEGDKCSGLVDLGVGRLPITTPEQGDEMLRKVMHYADSDATHGLWKNDHLLMADNDLYLYANNAETLDKVLDTAWNVVTTKKLYMDSYPVVSTPSGNRCPQVNQMLVDYFDHGVGVMSYTGHGGVKALASEWVFSLSDIQAMNNYDRMPFVMTATCEFSKFDDPSVVSGGELMMLNPSGGAAALLTTVRPSVASNNQKMSISFHEHLYDIVDGQHLRFGDLYRIVKSDPKYYTKSNILYVLFGDPVVRFSCPSNGVRTDAVEGSDLLSLTGCITEPGGDVDTSFNGVLDLRLYDQKTSYTSLGVYDKPINYSYHNDVLFEGKASVVNGCFEAYIPVPATVSQGTGKAKLVYSAYDSVRKVEAEGAFHDLMVQSPSEGVDTQGPEIVLSWDETKRVLCADLSDEHGIYHYNVSIGRDIVMNSNVSYLNNVILNDRYEPAVDDYRRGRILLPLEDLPDGTYEFTLKAWDTWNNSSDATIVVLVDRDVLLAEVRSYPNPFSDEVFFSFIDGEQTQSLDVQLEVYDMMGRCVARLQEHTSSTSGVVPPIRWDGRGFGGIELKKGMYFYKMSITDAAGKTKSVALPMVKK